MIQRAESGAIYPASEFNKIRDAAVMMLDSRQAGGENAGNGMARNPVLIRVKNVSENDVPAFGVLRVTQRLYPDVENPVTSALNGGVEMKGEAPNDDDNQTLCILQEAVKAGGIGRGVLWAATGVRIDVKDTAHSYAKGVSGDVKKLQSTDSGPWRIVEKPSGTGEQFCYVCPAGGGGGGGSVETGTLRTELAYGTTAFLSDNTTKVTAPLLAYGRSYAAGTLVYYWKGSTSPYRVITGSKLNNQSAFPPPTASTDAATGNTTFTTTISGASDFTTTIQVYVNNNEFHYLPSSPERTGPSPFKLTDVNYPAQMFAFTAAGTLNGAAIARSPVLQYFHAGLGANAVETTAAIDGEQVKLTMTTNFTRLDYYAIDVGYAYDAAGTTTTPGTQYSDIGPLRMNNEATVPLSSNAAQTTNVFIRLRYAAYGNNYTSPWRKIGTYRK